MMAARAAAAIARMGVNIGKGQGAASGFYVVFDGTTKIDCGSDASIDDLPDGNQFTLDAWVKTDVDATGVIACKGTQWHAWSLRVRFIGKLEAFINTDNTSAQSRSNGVFNNDGLVHHLRMTYDDNGDRKIRLYVDGVEVTYAAQTAAIGNYISDASDNLVIGQFTDGNTPFSGDIYWCRLSDNIRSDSPAKCTPPDVDGNTIEQWNLDEGLGATATAQVNTPANDGVITNGTWQPCS